MKRLPILLLFPVLALASVPASAAPIVFRADLSGPAEEPPNASTGTGVARVTIDDVAHMMRVEVSFSDLVSPVTVSHIHVINGPGDANVADTIGPVATAVPTFPGFPAGVMAGVYDETFDTLMASTYNPAFVTNSGGSLANAELQLFAAIMSGRAYLNVHSSQFPGGEIRGFLTPVPEPSALALVGLAATGLLASRRRRARSKARA